MLRDELVTPPMGVVQKSDRTNEKCIERATYIMYLKSNSVVRVDQGPSIYDVHTKGGPGLGAHADKGRGITSMWTSTQKIRAQ